MVIKKYLSVVMSWLAENAMVGAAVVSWFEEETVGVIQFGIQL